MTNYLQDGIYDRAIEGTGENLPTVANPDGSVVFQYRYVFSGETLLEQPTGNPIPTYDFAGFAFASASGVPYDTVARVTESKNDVGGNRIYLNHLIDMTYTSNGAVYYHQQYNWAGTGQGYIASEWVSGSALDSTFYHARTDYYDPSVRLTSQFYEDANGSLLMRSAYAYNEGANAVPQPWKSVEVDTLYTAGEPQGPYHHVYRLADGTAWADIRHVDSTHDLVTGSAVTGLGFASRFDYIPGYWGPEKQEYRDPAGNVLLTVDIAYQGVAVGVRVEGSRVTYGSALDDEAYYKITDVRDFSGSIGALAYRLYNMDDGAHLFEIKMALQYGVPNTHLGSGVTNADDIYRLFGADTLEFTGRFGHDTVYDFDVTNPGGGFGRHPLNFSDAQFADLAAIRSAAVIDGSDVVVTNNFGDTLTLKDVIHGAMTINDVLTTQTTAIVHDYFV